MMRRAFSVALMACVACVFALAESTNAGVTIDVVFQDGTGHALTIPPGDPGPGCSFGGYSGGSASVGRCADLILMTDSDLIVASASVQFESDNGLALADAYEWKGVAVEFNVHGQPVKWAAPHDGVTWSTGQVGWFEGAVPPPNASPSLAPGIYRIGTIVWDTSGTVLPAGQEIISVLTNGVGAVINGNIVDITKSVVLGTGILKVGVALDWVIVGDPGNAADDTGYGAVAYTYRIGKYEVTNAQYAAFLNAVAATDTYGLYDTSMGSSGMYYWGGITRSGSPGSYTYSTIAGREDMPVNWVSWYDSLRFANWLHNGQPAGAQDSTTTEDGAYDMSLGSSVVRKTGAMVFLPSEDEWYKAAYYDTALDIYYDYPARSDTQTTCVAPGATANTANCHGVVGDLSDVGSYTGSAGPRGSFDQGGNVREWNEALIGGSVRGVRGGSFVMIPIALSASSRDYQDPVEVTGAIGFRVASLPEPVGVPSLRRMGVTVLGVAVFSIGIVGLVIAARRRFNGPSGG